MSVCPGGVTTRVPGTCEELETLARGIGSSFSMPSLCRVRNPLLLREKVASRKSKVDCGGGIVSRRGVRHPAGDSKPR